MLIDEGYYQETYRGHTLVLKREFDDIWVCYLNDCTCPIDSDMQFSTALHLAHSYIDDIEEWKNLYENL